MKRIVVVFALPARQWSWPLELEDSATVAEALEIARQAARGIDVPWDGDVGIYGEPCDRTAIPRDGDRIEIYRPLKSDPKVSRRVRAAAVRAATDRASSPPRSPVPKPTR